MMTIFFKDIAKNFPIVSRFLLFVLLPATVLIGYKVNLWRQSLPVQSGILRVAGIAEPVALKRDDNGVVYIEAKTDKDAFFGLGYAHAQDRMWQLELQRRIAKGTLSEIFGGVRLGQDSWMRALGLYPSAEQAWLQLSPEAQASLTAYASGINSYLANTSQLPVEFEYLQVIPQPWTEVDSLAWAKVFALNLANNMWAEIGSMARSKLVDNPAVRTLLQIQSDSEHTTVTTEQFKKMQTQVDALLGMKNQLETDLKVGGKFVGSNAWVVAGKYTQSGKPLLANDPHVGLQIPSVWYMADLQGDTLDVAGMTLVGMPMVIFGQNASIAWGGTAMGADVQDLYIERVNPDNPKQYFHQGEWRDFDVRYESIDVKAEMPASLREKQQPAKIKIRSTVNGPVISDFKGPFEVPLTLKWTALIAKDTTYESFYRLNFAQNWQEFNEALSYHVAPTMNMLYADGQNNIGYVAAGKIPIRANSKGKTPNSGENAKFGWTGYIPFELLPKSFNPPQGYIISANNKIIDDEYNYFITDDWALPARFKRIKQLLDDKINKKQKIDMTYIQEMQGDTMDLSALDLLSTVLQFSPRTLRQTEAMDYITQFKGDMAGDQQGASIFHVWMRHLRSAVLRGELKAYWNDPVASRQVNSIIGSIDYPQLNQLLKQKITTSCHDKTSCDNVLSIALDDTLSEIEKLLVDDMEDWQWHHLQSTVYQHTPFSFVKFFDVFFERRIKAAGSVNSINVASSNFTKSNGYEQKFGAGFRQIMRPASDATGHWYINSTGQSGNVFSQHYDDMVEPFAQVQLFHLYPFDEIPAANSVILTPQ